MVFALCLLFGAGVCFSGEAKGPPNAPPADDLYVSLFNATDLEIVWPTIFTDDNGVVNRIRSGFLSKVLPGGRVNISQPNAGRPVRMVLDMGLAIYEFPDVSRLAGGGRTSLVLGFDESAGEPFLEVSGGGAGVSRIRGILHPPLTGAQSEPVALEQLLAATITEAERFALDSELTAGSQTLPVFFAGEKWIGAVYAAFRDGETPLQEGPGEGVDEIVLLAEFAEPRLWKAVQAFLDTGYKPWCIHVDKLDRTANTLELEEYIAFTRLTVRPGEESPQPAALLSTRRPTDAPGEALMLLVTDQTYREAASGLVVTRQPAWMVRLSNSAMIELRYYSDCRTLAVLSESSLAELAWRGRTP